MLIHSPHIAGSHTTKIHLPINHVVFEGYGVYAADVFLGLIHLVNRDCRLPGVTLTTLQVILFGDTSGLR